MTAVNVDTGDCFPVALEIATLAVKRAPGALLVHGTPVGLGDANAGRRYWHAWVEVPALMGWVVLDYSNGGEFILPLHQMYRVGRLSELHVVRYTPQEAVRCALSEGHFGPWRSGVARCGDAL